MSKYDDCHRVDNRYTTAIGMSVWRFFNIGKYKNQKSEKTSVTLIHSM